MPRTPEHLKNSARQVPDNKTIKNSQKDGMPNGSQGPWTMGPGGLGPNKIMNSMCFEDMEKMRAEINCLAKQFPHH